MERRRRERRNGTDVANRDVEQPVASSQPTADRMRSPRDARPGQIRKRLQKSLPSPAASGIAAINQDVAVRTERRPDRRQRTSVGIEICSIQRIAAELDFARAAVSNDVNR